MSIDQYLGKSIIAWHSYNPNYEDPYGRPNTITYVYPQIVEQNKNNYESILHPLDEFPQFGRIEVKIQGGDNAHEVYRQLGSLVTVRVNQYPEMYSEGKNNYSLKYNSAYGKESSAIWMEKFSGKGFYQVLDLQAPLRTDPVERTIPLPVSQIYTRKILLRYETRMYGPFEYDVKEGEILLFGDQGNEYIVAEYESIAYNDEIFMIVDQNNEEAALLLPTEVLEEPLNCEITYDWISKEKLIDIFMKCLKNRDYYSKNQLNLLKETLTWNLISDENSEFTESRAKLVQSYLFEVFQISGNARDLIQFTLEDKELKGKLLDDLLENNFDLVSSNLVECTMIKEEIAQLEMRKTSLEKEVDGYVNQKDEVQSIILPKISGKNEELLELLEEKEKLIKENEQLLEKLATVDKFEKLNADIADLEKQKQIAHEDYENKMREKFNIEDAIKKMLKDFGDTKELTQKLLEDKLLERVIRSFNGEQEQDFGDLPSEVAVSYEAHTGDQIITSVSNYIREVGHRDVSDNDVINYLICVTQGFITTFAGEPGTGKTSICDILAKSLGLFPQGAEKRYVDISVERGWTSHRDFIGYYNPLTKTKEKSNAEVFKAFNILDRESENTSIEKSPFLSCSCLMKRI